MADARWGLDHNHQQLAGYALARRVQEVLCSREPKLFPLFLHRVLADGPQVETLKAMGFAEEEAGCGADS